MPKGLNKRLGKNAIVSTLLKNVRPIEHWRELYPNDFKLKRFKFVVDDIENTDASIIFLCDMKTMVRDDLKYWLKLQNWINLVFQIVISFKQVKQLQSEKVLLNEEMH